MAARLISDFITFRASPGQTVTVVASMPSLQFGGGRYTVSASIYKELDLDEGSSVSYDVVSRSLEFTVVPAFRNDPSLFYQPHSWNLRNRT